MNTFMVSLVLVTCNWFEHEHYNPKFDCKKELTSCIKKDLKEDWIQIYDSKLRPSYAYMVCRTDLFIK